MTTTGQDTGTQRVRGCVLVRAHPRRNEEDDLDDGSADVLEFVARTIPRVARVAYSADAGALNGAEEYLTTADDAELVQTVMRVAFGRRAK